MEMEKEKEMNSGREMGRNRGREGADKMETEDAKKMEEGEKVTRKRGTGGRKWTEEEEEGGGGIAEEKQEPMKIEGDDGRLTSRFQCCSSSPAPLAVTSAAPGPETSPPPCW